MRVPVPVRGREFVMREQQGMWHVAWVDQPDKKNRFSLRISQILIYGDF